MIYSLTGAYLRRAIFVFYVSTSPTNYHQNKMKKRAKKSAAVAQVWETEDRTTDEALTETLSMDVEPTTSDASDIAAEQNQSPNEADLGDTIDGTEDELTDEKVAASVGSDGSPQVAAAVKAAAAAAKVTKERTTMATTMTKADQIRAEIERRKKSNSSTRPKDIIEALEKRGVKVTAPQVSVLVRDIVGAAASPAKPERSRAATAVKKPEPAAKTQAQKKAAKTTAPINDGHGYDALFAAAHFVGSCGSLAEARAVLSTYERLTAAQNA